MLHADERGSIVAESDSSGNAVSINRYDEYGKPAATNAGRFQYTGQLWLPEAGLYHYKARAYAPHLGRFMQADPIGYAGGVNLYAYVGNDPVNWIDPLGLQENGGPDITVTGPVGIRVFVASSYFGNTQSGCDNGAFFAELDAADIVVIGERPQPDAGDEGTEIVVVGTRPQPSQPLPVELASNSLTHVTFCGTYTPGGASGAGSNCQTMTRDEACSAAQSSERGMADTAWIAGGASTASTLAQRKLPGWHLFTAWIWLSRAGMKNTAAAHCG